MVHLDLGIENNNYLGHPGSFKVDFVNQSHCWLTPVVRLFTGNQH